MKVTTPDFQHASQLSSSKVHIPKDRNQWAGVPVIIKKVGHPSNGYMGVVQTVLYGQGTRSGMKVQIELTCYNPTCGFQMLTVDYDSLVHAQ